MDDIIQAKLKNFGYDEFFESGRRKLGLAGFSAARVTVEHKGAYGVINEKGEFLAKITGKRIFNASSREDYPAVGDWVAITELDTERAVIHGVLPRKTVIKRKFGNKNKAGDKVGVQIIGANIDVAFIVESIGRDYNLNRFERYCALVRDGGVQPAIVLNKIDLLSKEELDLKRMEIKSRFDDVDIVLTSTASGQGLNELSGHILSGKTYCFLGSSGVGKSSLINKLIGGDFIRTGDIGSYSGRGKHVTVNREMYFLESGGMVIDNPGMREVGIINASSGIDDFFNEIAALAQECKYADCAHINEPGCEILAAVKLGKLDKEKYSNYISLKKEVEYCEMNDIEKKEKDRRFGKFIKSAKKELKKIGRKD